MQLFRFQSLKKDVIFFFNGILDFLKTQVLKKEG